MKENIKEYVSVMLDGRKYISRGIDEFNAFLSIAKVAEVEAVDFYGENSPTGIQDIRGGNFLAAGVCEFIAELDARQSLVIDECMCAEYDIGPSLSETKPDADPSSHDAAQVAHNAHSSISVTDSGE